MHDLICISSARYRQTAKILKPVREVDADSGYVVIEQDEETNEITKKWYPSDDNPDTPDVEGNMIIPCMAEAIMDNGIRTNSASERLQNGRYFSYEYIQLTFPAYIHMSKRDKVTNVTDATGKVIWVEEETVSEPTIFTVTGVKPVTDAFGNHVENVALLARSEVQQ